MAWNEPGGGNNKDPWGGRGDQGPPDLDEVVRKMQDKLGGLFGGRKRGGSSGGSGAGFTGLGLIIGIAAIVWLFSGIYIVDAGKQGVVLRFGAFSEITMPGPHWRIPYPVEQVEIVDVEQRRFVEIGYRSGGAGQSTVAVPREALMLTEDENLVEFNYKVQFRVAEAQNFLFKVRDPESTVRDAAESALRESVGTNRLDAILEGTQRETVRMETFRVLQETLDRYEAGVLVTQFNFTDVNVPAQVREAYSDVIRAREDRERFIEEARVHANSVIPEARGQAARVVQEAEGYQAATIALAEGEAQRFSLLLEEYQKAPEITRKRLYLQTMENVFGRSRKVLMDADSSGNVLYLPLDQLTGQAGSARPVPPPVIGTDSGSGVNSESARNARREARQ